MTHPLKVLFVAAEATPFIKVGGLADVAGALPKAMVRRGHDVRLVIPCYSGVDKARWGLSDTHHLVEVNHGNRRYEARVWESLLGGTVKTYLVENDELLRRDRVYGEHDDLDRFLFLSRAALALPRTMGWYPHVFHCNDWPTAFIPAILHNPLPAEEELANAASLLTIHNMAYQGWFDPAWAAEADVARYVPPSQEIPNHLLWRALSLGIYYADALSTVSETYAKEILTPQLGQELEHLLRQRQRVLLGITNGLDYEYFDPSTDDQIFQRYDVRSLDKKKANKQALQRRMGLAQDNTIPLVGNVGRLAEMKGVSLMLATVESLLRDGQRLQFATLGTGETELEEQARGLAMRFPQQVTVVVDYNEALSRLVYSGSDIFFMPSRFEPCGLGQLIAMRYGTIPVVHRTGGLADTVRDGMTGFCFEEFSTQGAGQALRRALEAWQEEASWRQLMVNAMSQDFSWEASAAKYEEAYRLALTVHAEGRCQRLG